MAVHERRQHYRGDTLILETEVVCDGGAIRLIEFMPAGEGRWDVVRIVEGVEGEVPMEMMLDVRFGYGANTPWITPIMNGFAFVAGPDAGLVRGTVGMDRSTRGVVAAFSVRQGDRVALQFNWHPSHLGDPPELDVERELTRTEQFWLDWSGRCTYQGRWREAVMRSLITLKALSYAPTGGIVAAPTTSLPEELGGVRNWDYRYCWLRDASLTIVALTLSGYLDEAIAFRDWLMRAAAGAPREVQIMYDLHGGRRLDRVRTPLAAGLRGLQAGPRGQRGLGSVSARRLWRAGGQRLSGPQDGRGGQGGRARLVADRRRPREPGVGAPRQRPLGGTRRSAPLHLLQDHGLGGDRPLGAAHRRVR